MISGCGCVLEMRNTNGFLDSTGGVGRDTQLAPAIHSAFL